MVALLTPEQLRKKHEVFTRLDEGDLRSLQRIGVAIVAFKDDEPCELGSGVCVKIDDWCFIATAAHVIDKYPNESRFLSPARTVPELAPTIRAAHPELKLR